MKKLALTLTLLAACGSAEAAPSVSAVSGTISDGQSITISGAAFGPAGPTILVFDDFSRCSVVGADVGLSATVGSWSSYGTYHPTCDAWGKGGMGARVYADGIAQRQLQKVFPSKISEAFISYWVGIPPGTLFPGSDTLTTFPDLSSWKFTWLMNMQTSSPGTDPTDNDICTPTYDMPNTMDLSGNALKPAPRPQLLTSADSWWSWTAHNRMSVWLKGAATSPDVNNGIAWYMAASPEGIKTATTSTPIFKGGAAPFQWGHVNVPGWIRSSRPNVAPVMDDIYIAIGENAAARVEIGNSSTYTDCTNMTILTPTAWSDGAITATVRSGSFANGAPAYLYVVDANGNVSNGRLVTFGGIDTTPPVSASSLASGRHQTTRTVALTSEPGATVKYCRGAGCTPAATYTAPVKALQNVAAETIGYASTDGANNVEATKYLTLRKQKRK